jgi:hypothetical protein
MAFVSIRFFFEKQITPLRQQVFSYYGLLKSSGSFKAHASALTSMNPEKITQVNWSTIQSGVRNRSMAWCPWLPGEEFLDRILHMSRGGDNSSPM